MAELRLFYQEDGKLRISKTLDTLKKIDLKKITEMVEKSNSLIFHFQFLRSEEVKNRTR